VAGIERFDVAIVGAGPAGCRAAWRMARAGARVAMVDGSYPREKPCGGGVTGRALDVVRDAIDCGLIDAVSIRGAAFEHGAARVQMTFDNRPSAELVVASRTRFDTALLDAAIDAGATLVAERVTDVLRDGEQWRIATRGGAVRAGWVLGADGPNGLMRRRVSRPFARADLSIATGFFVHGVSSSDITVAFEDDPPGYLWSFPRRDHLAVGVCAQADETSTARLLPFASRWIARNVPAGSTLERYSWPIPSLREATLRREVPSGPGWMLLGDAGGMVDPITREGIFFALLSADAAADCLIESGGDPAGRYAARIRATIYDELVRAARLKARFFNPRFTGLLIRALEKSAPVRAVMVDLIAGRQPYRGLRRRLLATMEVKLLIEMLRR
jgi:geranylgeranyl reductase family protein